VAIVVLGIGADVALVSTWRVVRADREAELLFRGRAYRRAIESYHRTHGEYPRSLEALTLASSATHRRHLRRLYDDPVAPGRDWRLVHAAGGGISGVASTSTDAPLKTADFTKEFESFSGAKSYSEWIFDYAPPPTSAPKAPPPSPAAT
jgi:type II secretory pathway pseudopilin PulG